MNVQYHSVVILQVACRLSRDNNTNYVSLIIQQFVKTTKHHMAREQYTVTVVYRWHFICVNVFIVDVSVAPVRFSESYLAYSWHTSVVESIC